MLPEPPEPPELPEPPDLLLPSFLWLWRPASTCCSWVPPDEVPERDPEELDVLILLLELSLFFGLLFGVVGMIIPLRKVEKCNRQSASLKTNK